MFERSAALYDAFYEALGKDYEAEAQRVLALVSERDPAAKTLLDVACGTGRHVELLSRSLECIGLDLDSALLDVARRRCPDVTFVGGDMVEFELSQRFGVVTCLFSSIGYVVTNDRLVRAVERMAAHLDPGGLLLVEPWFLPEQWTEGLVQVLEAEHDGQRAVRMMRSGREADVAVLDAHYLVGGPSRVRHFTERHELGLFSREQYEAAFTSAGLTIEWDPDGLCGRGLIIGAARK